MGRGSFLYVKRFFKLGGEGCKLLLVAGEFVFVLGCGEYAGFDLGDVIFHALSCDIADAAIFLCKLGGKVFVHAQCVGSEDDLPDYLK